MTGRRFLLPFVLVAVAAPAQKPGAANRDAKLDKVTAKDPVVVALDAFAAKKKVSKKRPDWRTELPEPPRQTFPQDRDYFWHLQTNHGVLTARLRADVAPMHVTSVIYLTRLGFYDGLEFHRAIKQFMVQGGCPRGDGRGNPGYTMAGEFADHVRHDRAGILSMANEGRPKTEGSQFFITFAPAPHLDGKHTVFGEITEGSEVLRALEERSGSADADRPTAKLVLERAWIRVAQKPKDQGAQKDEQPGARQDPDVRKGKGA